MPNLLLNLETTGSPTLPVDVAGRAQANVAVDGTGTGWTAALQWSPGAFVDADGKKTVAWFSYDPVVEFDSKTPARARVRLQGNQVRLLTDTASSGAGTSAPCIIEPEA